MDCILKLMLVIVTIQLVESQEILNITEVSGKGTLIMNNTGKENCSLLQVSPVGVKDYFQVNVEENLVLSKSLDLEVIFRDYNTGEGINVIVVCADGMKIKRTIYVEPVNEFDPEFIQKPYEIEIPEDTAIGTPVFCLYCTEKLVTDGDHIKYGRVTNFTFIPHEIQGLDGAYKFAIDAVTGNITTTELFDYESRNTLFYLKVQAEDEGGRVGDASIKVTINDTDDNPPQFVRPYCVEISCTVSEYSADVDSFTQGKISNILPSAIHAEDIDTIVNNSLTYALFSSGEDRLVSNIWLDNVTGDLSVLEPFYNITDVTNDAPITLLFEITATEISTESYCSNVTFILKIYRSLTTLPPITTSEPPKTPEASKLPVTDKSKNRLVITLIEIIVPSVIVIVIILAVILLALRRKRMNKERSMYEVKEGSKNYQNVIGDRDQAVEPRSSFVISPYELVDMYGNSHYARLNSMDDTGDVSNQSQGQGQVSSSDDMDDGTTHENEDPVVMQAENNDNLYARVEKKRAQPSKGKVEDVFAFENYGNEIGDHEDSQHPGIITHENEATGAHDTDHVDY